MRQVAPQFLPLPVQQPRRDCDLLAAVDRKANEQAIRSIEFAADFGMLSAPVAIARTSRAVRARRTIGEPIASREPSNAGTVIRRLSLSISSPRALNAVIVRTRSLRQAHRTTADATLCRSFEK